MVVKLGDLSLKNYFEDSEIGGGVLQHWDHMYLSLDSVQVIRFVEQSNSLYMLQLKPSRMIQNQNCVNSLSI